VRLVIRLGGLAWLAASFAAPSAAVAQRLPATAEAPARFALAPPGERLRAPQIGLVINTADPYSVQVGAYYARQRGLAPAQVLHVELPVRARLTEAEFDVLRGAVSDHFGPRTQALALAWVTPYAVACNSITGALALGFDAGLCADSCAPSRPSPYFGSASTRPLTDFAFRPSMLLAAPSIDQAMALIDRGVAADGVLSMRGRPTVNAMFLTTGDAARNVRSTLYPAPGRLADANIGIRVEPAEALRDATQVLLALTGSARLNLPPTIDWAPGALADHLTSVGGALDGQHAQSTALEWIASGATASFGSVSEPCNHRQKFPHPQVLLQNYVRGSTAIEAYWKSVAWPQQGVFIGEPLAAPFARR
jgi:uncharacterized protein (TIGR03790 family)